MDKLLPFIDWLKRNRFWLGCGLLSIAMIATWFWITMQIEDQTEKFTSEVKSQIQVANNIIKVSAEEGADAHPNSHTETGMKKELNKSLESLIEAWRLRHEAQQSVLKWPTDIIGSEEFVKAFSRFNPPETFPEEYEGGYGLERYLQLYRVTIPKQLEKLCEEKLRAKWNYGSKANADDQSNNPQIGGGRGGARGGGRGGERGGGAAGSPNPPQETSRYAVIWDDANQALWNKKLTEFKGLDDHFLPVVDPTPLQVYMLQQDLWLLEAIFDIIRSVNGDADANDLAVIKRIDHIAIGREARTQLGSLTPYDPLLRGSVASGDESAGDSAADASFLSRGSMGRGAPAQSAGGDGFDKFGSNSPYHGRYVGVDFEPITADLVRSVLTGDTLPEEHLELIVAKRVPVRIALRMDERKIPEFMTACANSPFAFEINQIRLNRHQPGEGIEFNGGGYGGGNQQAGGAGSAPGRGMGMGMGSGMGRGGGGGRGGEAGGMGAGIGGDAGGGNLEASPVEIRTNYDVDVEFYGIVKIYNPVREKFLRRAAGQQEEDSEPVDAAATTQAGSDPAKP